MSSTVRVYFIQRVAIKAPPTIMDERDFLRWLGLPRAAPYSAVITRFQELKGGLFSLSVQETYRGVSSLICLVQNKGI